MRRIALPLSAGLLAGVVSLAACARQVAPALRTSSATTPQAAGMVDVATLAPDIVIDMRYAGERNFVGARIDGYLANRCYLHAAVARALAQVQRDVAAEGLRLRVFDCYRPVRAVRHFMRWVDDAGDQRTRAEYYPALAKAALKGDYIAERSGHSRGATLDLTLERCAAAADCTPLDMGTAFDLFDARAHTASPRITPEQAANRAVLVQAMARRGFANYALEWWHYTYRPEPTPYTQFDLPVR